MDGVGLVPGLGESLLLLLLLLLLPTLRLENYFTMRVGGWDDRDERRSLFYFGF